MKWWRLPSPYRYVASDFSIRTALNFSPLRKLCSKMDPSRMLRSLALMMAPARASLMCSTVTMLSSLPSISKALPALKSFVSINQVLHCHQIAARPQALDDADRGWRRHVPGAEALRSGVEVGDVHLDHRRGQGPQAVVEGIRVVGQRARVDHDTGRGRRLVLQEVDDRAFGVRLEAGHLAAELAGAAPDHRLDVRERGGPVHVRLPAAEQVEVGPV